MAISLKISNVLENLPELLLRVKKIQSPGKKVLVSAITSENHKEIIKELLFRIELYASLKVLNYKRQDLVLITGTIHNHGFETVLASMIKSYVVEIKKQQVVKQKPQPMIFSTTKSADELLEQELKLEKSLIKQAGQNKIYMEVLNPNWKNLRFYDKAKFPDFVNDVVKLHELIISNSSDGNISSVDPNIINSIISDFFKYPKKTEAEVHAYHDAIIKIDSYKAINSDVPLEDIDPEEILLDNADKIVFELAEKFWLKLNTAVDDGIIESVEDYDEFFEDNEEFDSEMYTRIEKELKVDSEETFVCFGEDETAGNYIFQKVLIGIEEFIEEIEFNQE